MDPYCVERLDLMLDQHRHTRPQLESRPSEIVRSTSAVVSTTESFGLAVREHVGSEKCLLSPITRRRSSCANTASGRR